MDGGQSVLEQAPTMQQPAFALSLALASCAFAQGNLHFHFGVHLTFEDDNDGRRYGVFGHGANDNGVGFQNGAFHEEEFNLTNIK